MYCRTCGRPLPPAAALCPACGAPVDGPLALSPVPAHAWLPEPQKNCMDWLREGWQTLRKSPAPLIIFVAIYFALTIGLSFVIGLISGSYNAALHPGTQPSSFMMFVGNLLSLGLSIVLMPLTWGVVMYALYVQRGETPAGDTFLAGYGRPWQVVVASLAPIAPVYVSMLAWMPFLPAGEHQLGGTAAHGDPVFSLALLLFFLPMTVTALVVTILLGLRWCLAPVLVMDRGMGPFAALKASSELTRGSRAQIFFLWLLNIPLTLAGLVACCVGLLVSVPVFLSSQAALYRDLMTRAGHEAPPAVAAAPLAPAEPPGDAPSPPPGEPGA